MYNKLGAMLLSLRNYLCNVFGWPHVQVCLNFVQSVHLYKHIHEIALSYLLSEFQRVWKSRNPESGTGAGSGNGTGTRTGTAT